MTLRLNITGVLPTVVTIKPKQQKALFMRTNTLLFKIWNDNIVMVQDRGEVPPKDMTSTEAAQYLSGKGSPK